MSYHDDVRTLRDLYTALQAEHPRLRTVPFQVNPRLTSRLGRTRYAYDLSTGRYEGSRYVCDLVPQVVEVARWVIEADPAEALDTLIHEAAHALAGYEAAHGPVWKRICRALGGKPERCSTNRALAKAAPKNQRGPKWRWTCPTCGATDTRFKRSKSDARYFHCGPVGAQPIRWTQLR